MRPAYDWIPRIKEAQKRFAELNLSTEEKERVDRWLEVEFVYSTLDLKGTVISRERVAALSVSEPDANAVGDSERAALSLRRSLRAVALLARESGKEAVLTAQLLVELHTTPGGTGGASLPAQALTGIEAACRWFSAESFAELHPVEQASIVLLRLIDIRPFEQANEQTALVAASLFTQRADLPPIIVRPGMRSAYCAALDEGSRMNTKPMVELLAETCESSLGRMIEQSGK
jgi:Fic/DOC family